MPTDEQENIATVIVQSLWRRKWRDHLFLKSCFGLPTARELAI
jgi:hypothetical protein